MVKDRFVSAYAEPEYTIGVGGSGGAIQQYVYGQNHAGPARRRRAAVLVPGHGHADDPRRRLRAARALARLEGAREPALDVADVGQPDADRGPERLGDDPEPVRGRDALHADAGLDRVHQRLARASRRSRSTRSGTRRGRCKARRATTRPSTARSSGRTGATSSTSTARTRRASPARRGTTSASSTGSTALKSGAITPRAVPRPERERRLVEAVEGHGPGGVPVHPGRMRSTAHTGRLERPQHEALARRRRHAGRAA